MTGFTIQTYELPSVWACYFINADPTGLSEQEKAAADRWWAETFKGQQVICTDISERSWFGWRHDAAGFCLATEVAAFCFSVEGC